MRKLIAFVLALITVLSFAGCSGEKPTVWDWAQELGREDLICVTPWRNDGEHKELESLSDEKTEELIALLNNLAKDSFTENRDLAGGTPTFGIQIDILSESYYINESISPNGSLEIRHNGKMWWIDNADLFDFVQLVTD